MKAQRITLHDIAELAGVTKMTVSRYLRTPEKVKPETAERIASVIAEIGYQPDPDNPAMTSVAVPRIGVLIPSFHNQIFADLLAGIESVAAGHGYQTLVVNYDYDRQREEEQIAAVLAFNVKGLLLTESVHSLRADKYLNAAKIPIAEVMGLAENPGRINVGFDNFQAGFDMTPCCWPAVNDGSSTSARCPTSATSSVIWATVGRWRVLGWRWGALRRIKSRRFPLAPA